MHPSQSGWKEPLLKLTQGQKLISRPPSPATPVSTFPGSL